MYAQDILMLNNEPLREEKSALTLSITSEDSGLRGGGDLPEIKEVEGKITYNPHAYDPFFLPIRKRGGSPVITPDRTRWDLYLMIMPFTLHPAPGENYYEKLTFLVKISDPRVTAFNLFPKQVTTEAEETKSYTISPHFTIAATVDIELGQVGKEIRFTTLHPTITAFGEGESRFFWIYEGGPGQKGVRPETKYVLMVLQVPHGMTSLEATISYKVNIAKKILGRWRSKKGATDQQLIQWNLKEARPFA